MISGTQQGTVTDVDSRYELNLPSADVSVDFQYVHRRPLP